MREFLSQILHYIQSIKIAPKNIFEMVVLAVILYFLMAWVKRSRAWALMRGLIVLVIFVLLANLLELNVISYIANRTLSILVIALLVLFQPELRAALEQIGQGKFLRGFFRVGRGQSTAWYPAEVVEAVVDATYVMAQNRTGALIVLEREISLAEYIKTGIRLDAVVSSALLINIFEHNTPLHDGAVIMQGEKVSAATCYLPLSQNMAIGKELGTRHRAAIGLSEETDSWIIVVSEETGQVSLAKRGTLTQNLRPDELRNELLMIETEFQRQDLRKGKGTEKGLSRRKKSERRPVKEEKQDAE
ncbi:MAG: diadenylate cyclase CdaA [Lachnospiraceae bacterium]|nr:diadenylate cyclase CdaA [Lachnospiraceae bacterium]